MRAFLLMFFLLPGVVSSATFLVTKESDDDGPCTPDDCALREAVIAANASPDPDIVEVPAGTYQLTLQGPMENFSMTGDLDISFDLVLRGESARTVTVIGDGTDRVLQVGTVFGRVEISGMTITGGVGEFGGGVFVAGPESILLKNLTVRNNTSVFGFGGGSPLLRRDLSRCAMSPCRGTAPLTVEAAAFIFPQTWSPISLTSST